MKIYGIPNCDTIKKTLDWFKANNSAFDFHNYKKDGISPTIIKSWSKQVGLHTIVNKKSTSWKALTAEEQAKMAIVSTAIPIIIKNPSIIKRPVIENLGQIVMVGFNLAEYDQKLKNL